MLSKAAFAWPDVLVNMERKNATRNTKRRETGKEMTMKRKTAKTYEATYRGKKTRVTVPAWEDPVEPGKALRDLLQDCMSPEAVAVVAFAVNAHLALGGTTGQAYRQADWFQRQLLAALGGQNAYERVCREAGL